MNAQIQPLLDDEYTGEPPSKRLLAHLISQREKNGKVVGMYCGYTPEEIVRAAGLIPTSLCAFAEEVIPAAEEVLPANLCPLVKSSYGLIVKDACPFFALSDAIIAETTCDGKKKMFEMIADRKPMFIMDLPQCPGEPESLDRWTAMIRKVQRFIESEFGRTATDEQIEQAICDTNVKCRLMNRVFDYAALDPPVIGWPELYDVLLLAQTASTTDMTPTLEDVLRKLETRREKGYIYGEKGAPRVMVSGCPIGPIGAGAAKVLTIIEEAGGVIVALDSCSGMKPYAELIEEGTGDPVRALAARYLKIPCACMTPNSRRLTETTRIIERFKPDAVVDVILHACHTFNIESFKVGEHARNNHGLPFLKIVTDFSRNDVGQIRTRVEALLELCSSPV